MTLSERIAAAQGADRALDGEINHFLHGRPYPLQNVFPSETWLSVAQQFKLDRWTSDLNVVVGEVERRGWTLSLATTNDGRAYCNVWVNNEDMASGDAHSPCLALLAALVAAVEAKP